MRNSAAQKAFTLLEIVVALSIGLVLVILSLLAGTKIYQSSRAAEGTSNMRTILRGAVNFAADHQGYLPVTTWPFSGYPNPWDGNDQTTSTPWFRWLHPYIYAEPLRDSKGRLLCDGTYRSPYLGGYSKYGRRAVIDSWDAVDFVPVYKFPIYKARKSDPAKVFHNLRKLKKLSSVPFLLTGCNFGGAGVRDEATFNSYCYHPSFPAPAPTKEQLPEGTAWVYDDRLLVGYVDGHVSAIKYNAHENMFERIFDQQNETESK